MTKDTELKFPANRGDVPGLDLKPVFSNRVNVTLNGLTTRIAFGERVIGDEQRYHVAVTMPTEDALALAKLIAELFEANPPAQKLQRALQAAKAEATLPAELNTTRN